MIELSGLHCGNLVGYLSALGVHRLISLEYPETTLHWDKIAILGTDLTKDQIVELIDKHRCYGFNGEFMTYSRQIIKKRKRGEEVVSEEEDLESTTDALEVVLDSNDDSVARLLAEVCDEEPTANDVVNQTEKINSCSNKDPLEVTSLCDIIAKVALDSRGRPTVSLGCQFPPGEWRRLTKQALDSNRVDILEVMGSLRGSLEHDRKPGKEEPAPAPSYLVRLRGNCGKNMLKAVRGLLQIDVKKIRRDLFNPWTYPDCEPKALALSLDDQEGNDKGSNPKQNGYTNHGAGLLALHGLPLFPCFDYQGRVKTTCADGPDFTYPVWSTPLGYAAVRYLIQSNFQDYGVQSYRSRSVSREKVLYLDTPILI